MHKNVSTYLDDAFMVFPVVSRPGGAIWQHPPVRGRVLTLCHEAVHADLELYKLPLRHKLHQSDNAVVVPDHGACAL